MRLQAQFAGAYLAVALYSLLAAATIAVFYSPTRLQATPLKAIEKSARPLGAIVRQPAFLASMLVSTLSWATMMFIMTATPLAAVGCHHSISDGASMIQWHLIGMFAPSFVVGRLADRYGLGKMTLAGIALSVGSAVIAMHSTTIAAFYVALFLLGAGWNAMFTCGTTMLTLSYRPNESGKTQGLAEFIRTGATAVATLGAGPALQHWGWKTMNASTGDGHANGMQSGEEGMGK